MASRGRIICQKLYPFVSSSNSYCPCCFTMLSSIPSKEHTSLTLLPCLPNSPVTWFYLHSTEAHQGTVPASCHCSYRKSLHLGPCRNCCSAQSQVTTTAQPPHQFLHRVTCPQAPVVSPHTQKNASTWHTPAFIFIFSIQYRWALQAENSARVCMCFTQDIITSSHQWQAEDQTPALQMPRAKGLYIWKHHSSWTNTWWKEPRI